MPDVKKWETNIKQVLLFPDYTHYRKNPIYFRVTVVKGNTNYNETFTFDSWEEAKAVAKGFKKSAGIKNKEKIKGLIYG